MEDGESYRNDEEVKAVVSYAKTLYSKIWKSTKLNPSAVFISIQFMQIHFSHDNNNSIFMSISSFIKGIITPYSAQRASLKLALSEAQLPSFTVGTAETFQGQERKVIIISTVRTDNEIGFVSDQRLSKRILHTKLMVFN